MSETDSAHSVTINIPRPRTFTENSAGAIKKQIPKKRVCDKAKTVSRLSETSHYYSLHACKPVQTDTMKRDDLLLSYRVFGRKQKRIKQKHRMEIKSHEAHKAINVDLQNRLHIDGPPNDVRAVTDIDEGYFRYLNDHSLTQYIPLYKSLKFKFHKQLRMRQEIGYRRDCVLNIEVNYTKELKRYELSVKKYMEQVKQFDEFIAEDYHKSMVCLQKCDGLEAKLNATVALIENFANQEFVIQSRLIGLDYMYFLEQKYGRFLYYLSPPSWRSKNRDFARSVEIEAKGFDLGFSSEEDTFNVIFDNMQTECCRGLIKPVLYFNRPDDLVTLFGSMEKQLLHHFVHVTPLAPYALKLKKEIIKLKRSIEHDTALVSHLIKDFVKYVDFCEEREAQLQVKFMKILNGLFYDTVASKDVLKLQTHLEFCYEKLLADIPLNMRLASIAKALERMYMEYLFRLDAFTNDKIKLAMKRVIQREEKKMKKAEMASRELRSFKRLEHSLLRAHEKRNLKEMATRTPIVKVPLFRKSVRFSKPAIRCSSYRALTEAEVEYLHLFTDWTETEDPTKYLRSLSVPSTKNSL